MSELDIDALIAAQKDRKHSIGMAVVWPWELAALIERLRRVEGKLRTIEILPQGEHGP